jgi:hypothetical protein
MRSDVDLLGIVSGGRIKRGASVRGTNLHLYPYDYLESRSQRGDLFLLHLTREGKPLYDTAHAFSRIVESFQFKKSYRHEIAEASVVVWYCLENERYIESPKFRKRLFWAIRTLIIADAASHEKVVFGSKDIDRYSGLSDCRKIIDNRNVAPSQLVLKLAASAVKKFGMTKDEMGLQSNRICDEDLPNFGDIAAYLPIIIDKASKR